MRVITKTVALIKWTMGLTLAAALAGCWGGGGGEATPAPIPVAAADVVVPVSSTTVAALAPVGTAAPVSILFNSGFSGVDAAGAPADIGGQTTVAFTSAGTATTPPAFKIDNGGFTATGDTTFGSCIFTVKVSTFPATSPLALGKVVKVDPCTITVNTAGKPADGSPINTTVKATFGSTTSTNSTISVTILANGNVLVTGGGNFAVVTVVAGTGGTGGGS